MFPSDSQQWAIELIEKLVDMYDLQYWFIGTADSYLKEAS